MGGEKEIKEKFTGNTRKLCNHNPVLTSLYFCNSNYWRLLFARHSTTRKLRQHKLFAIIY